MCAQLVNAIRVTEGVLERLRQPGIVGWALIRPDATAESANELAGARQPTIGRISVLFVSFILKWTEPLFLKRRDSRFKDLDFGRGCAVGNRSGV